MTCIISTHGNHSKLLTEVNYTPLIIDSKRGYAVRYIGIFIVILVVLPCNIYVIDTATTITPHYNCSSSNKHIWSMYQHDSNHTGRSEFNTSLNSGQKLWEFDAGYQFGSDPVIDSNGVIYAGTASSAGNFYAVYPNGTVKWKLLGYSTNSCPALGPDGVIYFQPQTNDPLFAIENGSIKWSFPVGGNITTFAEPTIPDYNYTFYGNNSSKWYNIYLGADQNMYVLDTNKTIKWTFWDSLKLFCCWFSSDRYKRNNLYYDTI